MCGFAGVFNLSFSVAAPEIAGVASRVSFRGPDSCGIRLYDHHLRESDRGNNAVFFNRLAIIDLDARSDQPFSDDRYVLLFNGEIYNYRELRQTLQAMGCTFHTQSDTEVLFRALQRWGADALSRLNGMFAFCWIDKVDKRFLLARDRMGIKPLYYRQRGGAFAFGSELDSVLRLSGDAGEIDPHAVGMYLWMQFIPTPYTIIKGAYKLPPGHYITGDWPQLEQGQELQSRAFWDAYDQVPGQGNLGPEDAEPILVDTLSRQLVADVPLGLFLSSGVDSSLLAALVNKHFSGSKAFNFFTVAFGEATSSDESRDAADLISGFGNPGLVSHTLTIDSSSIGARLEHLYDYFDEPFGDPASLLNWVISIKAREFVTVALSGDGADEMFWGYDRYAQWKNPTLHLTQQLAVSARLGGLLKPLLPGGYRKTKAILELEPDPLRRHFALFLSPALGHLLQQPVWDKPIWALQGIEKIERREDLVAWLDIKTYLADAMLHKVDRASMAASLEVRVPYLDNKVVDYALALPWRERSNSSFAHKAVLKQLLQRLAPHYRIDRPKKGFSFPLDSWLRFQWRDQVLDLVNRPTLEALGLDNNLYTDIVRRYYAGDKKNYIAVWYLFNLALWYRKYNNFTCLRPS
ncbi:MAG TPA: asparagine synthase (glutamine-hydrolyzing) [Puia sp.]|nr:asparagine synthase (glutamine-hydrolyzing) [Puia sp.]